MASYDYASGGFPTSPVTNDTLTMNGTSYTYDGSKWVVTGLSVNGTSRRQSFTATASQTTFTVTGGFDAGFVDVYMDGVKLHTSDFTDTSGTSIVLTTGASVGQLIDVIAYGTFTLANLSIADVASLQTALNGKEPADATILKDADIGSTVQAYDADLATVATNGVGTSANQIVQLDGTAKLPAVDGSLLTNLPASGIGEFILTSIAISSNDTALANESTTSNNSNIGILSGALKTNTTGQDNVAIGLNTLTDSNANGNTGVGKAALNENTSGTYNTGVGFLSGLYNTSGSYNLGLGAYSLWGHATSKLTGSHNIGLGYQTGYNLTTGQYNFLGGYQAGYSLTTGVDNVCLGKNAGRGGNFNDGVVIGADAGYGLSGGENVLIGSMAVQGSSNGSRNVVIGEKAGFLITFGGSNTIIGRYTGAQITTGSSNVCLGIYAGSGQGNFSNKLHIANNSTESLIEGDFSAKTLTINGALTDTVYSLTGTVLEPTLGSIQTLALSATRNLTDSVAEGQSIILMITGAATHVINWPAIIWVTSAGNVAPTLTDSATVVIWKVGSTLYGSYVGSYV